MTQPPATLTGRAWTGPAAEAPAAARTPGELLAGKRRPEVAGRLDHGRVGRVGR